MIKANVLKYHLPMFYCNAIGSQTEVVFDGASLIFDKDANLCKEFPMFEEALKAWYYWMTERLDMSRFLLPLMLV